MSRWSAGSVQTNGITMHYYRSGGNKPPLVLAHGLTDNGLCWKPIAQVLAETYDCVMPDARGHGFSSAPESGYTNADHAADYAGLIEALGLARPAVLGHSMGSGTTTQLAASYPQLVRGALLEDPPWRPRSHASGGPESVERAEAWRADILSKNQLTISALLAKGRIERPGWPDAEYDGWTAAKQQVDPKALDYARVSSMPWWEMVPQIKCPTLLITADVEKGAIVSQETAEAVAALNSRVQIAHIPGAGHSIRREQPQRYLAVVQAFLATLY
ncbi:MAG TPA: alpha/beta hydrolase [Caldilineaceae bacterium]|nr:alpha/beta hydrolase [Caldilineaceae bacterium]